MASQLAMYIAFKKKERKQQQKFQVLRKSKLQMFVAFPIEGLAVRLVGPTNVLGRVEVYHNGEWGTVCDNKWTLDDGHVVCRMLGFSKSIKVLKASAFGGGKDKIWLTKLQCNGTENSLFDCKNAAKLLGNTGCTHKQDSGVECKEKGKLSNIGILVPRAFSFKGEIPGKAVRKNGGKLSNLSQNTPL